MRRSVKFWVVLPLVLSCVGLLFAGAGDGLWRGKVPERDKGRANPFAENTEAAMAGGKLFEQNCASCHGKDAEGKGKKPPLRSERVREATPGELEWLLTNGNMKNGMPSWARLPEPQRWQIVTYLKSLQSPPGQ
ncbi:MAG TPA: cytochrome c [Terriglobales bacterium]|nr:cytochrome c [Terriglobales bacterium]